MYLYKQNTNMVLNIDRNKIDRNVFSSHYFVISEMLFSFTRSTRVCEMTGYFKLVWVIKPDIYVHCQEAAT